MRCSQPSRSAVALSNYRDYCLCGFPQPSRSAEFYSRLASLSDAASAFCLRKENLPASISTCFEFLRELWSHPLPRLSSSQTPFHSDQMCNAFNSKPCGAIVKAKSAMIEFKRLSRALILIASCSTPNASPQRKILPGVTASFCVQARKASNKA